MNIREETRKSKNYNKSGACRNHELKKGEKRWKGVRTRLLWIISLRYHCVLKRQPYSCQEMLQQKWGRKRKKGRKRSHENKKGTNSRQWVDRDRWGKAFPGMGEYGSLDWFMSHLGYQRIWMSKGSVAICYSNVMRLLGHTNILLQLKQKYWYSQGKSKSQF